MGKKRERKGGEKQNPSVAEATRIRISQILDEFRASKNEGELEMEMLMSYCFNCLPLVFFSRWISLRVFSFVSCTGS